VATTANRLNGIIAAFEADLPAFVAFSSAGADRAIEVSRWPYDGVILEMEHEPYSTASVSEFLQYLLDRRQILERGSPAPSVTPLVRIPSARGESNRWMARQSLDQGAYGIVWPHVETVEQARVAVATCRYTDADASVGPPGERGAGARLAARYFGLTREEYDARADVWPLAPHGEILVVIMIESPVGAANVPAMLSEVKGIGSVFIGHGDLARALGHPGDLDHPAVTETAASVLDACRDAAVPCGRVVGTSGLERALDDGYRFVVVQPEVSLAGLELGRRIAGRPLGIS
jgi:4-hydroxy-2-oxoheptanedioate aldolase